MIHASVLVAVAAGAVAVAVGVAVDTWNELATVRELDNLMRVDMRRTMWKHAWKQFLEVITTATAVIGSQK